MTAKRDTTAKQGTTAGSEPAPAGRPGGSDAAPLPSAPTSTGRRGRQPRSDGETTRARVLEAAVACILEEGYYQTSSNDIARRAGVTWGTLQYQFGSREALLLEVLYASWRELHDQIRSARITGDTLEARLESLLEVLATHYAQPAQLVQLQILLDLSHDPRTSGATDEALALHGAELNRLWHPLFEQVLGEMAEDLETTRYVFLVSRGYLIGRLIASSISRSASDDGIQRRMLVDGMAHAVRQRYEALRGGSAG